LLDSVRKVFGIAHGLTRELQPVGIVHQAVEDRIGHSGVADHLVPLVDGKLAGDQGGPRAVAIIDDFQELAVDFPRDAGDAEIIHLCGAPHKWIHVKCSVMWSSEGDHPVWSGFDPRHTPHY